MSITYNNEIEERFVPIAYDEILTGYLNHFGKENETELTGLWRVINLYYYCAFYSTMQKIKLDYQPFNPDIDTIVSKMTTEEYKGREKELFEQMMPLLNSANFELLTKEMLEETMNKTSPYGVEVSVDFDDFDDIQIYYRGESIHKESRRDPKKLYLKRKEVIQNIYRRLFLIIKPKHIDDRAKEIADATGKDVKKVKRKLERSNIVLSHDKENREIHIKIFKEIPQEDLEMLFPNTKVVMTLFDKIKLGTVGGGGTAGGGATLFAKLSAATLEPLSALIALGAFGGILWRQVKEVISRRNHYMAELSRKLYFHNLSSNAGALNYMADIAREEECKEVLLAYLFLSHNKEPITAEQLDGEIEAYIKQQYDITMDFEVADGLNKLRDIGVLTDDDGLLSVIGIDASVEIMRAQYEKISNE